MPHQKHYRDVFKSDHLAVSDLDGFIQQKHSMIFTVKNVTQQMNIKVAGKSGDFNIAHFKENIKPLVLNAGNSKIMSELAGGSCFIEEWLNIAVQLYIETGVRSPSGGELTRGIRINKNPPKIEKPVISKENMKMWEKAKTAFIRDGNFQKVLERAVISVENQNLIKDEVEQTAKETGVPE